MTAFPKQAWKTASGKGISDERLREEESAQLMTTLLRIATAGSVDDGKSTLIGRLLYDSKA